MLNDFTFVFHLKTKCMQKAFLLRLFRVSLSRVLVGTGITSSLPCAKLNLRTILPTDLFVVVLFLHIAMASTEISQKLLIDCYLLILDLYWK